MDAYTSLLEIEKLQELFIKVFIQLLFKGYKIPMEKNPGDDKTDEEVEGTHSEDEMFAQRGLRRTQSMKSVKTIKGRKEASIIFLKH